MILHAPQRHQKVMNPTIDPLPIDQTRNDHGVIGRLPQRPRPELGTCQRWRMNDPLPSLGPAVYLLQKRGRRLQRANVAPVPQFRLGVAPDHLEVATEGEPERLLLGVAEGEDVGHEHDPVEGCGEGVVGEGGDEGLEFFGGRDFSLQGRWPGVGADAGGAAELDQSHELGEGAGVSLGSVEVVVVVVGEDAGRVADDEGFEAAAPVGEGGGTAVEEVGDAEGGEGGGGAFGGQVGVDGLGRGGVWMAGVGVGRGGGAHGGELFWTHTLGKILFR
mmetsp:Transcript_17506/g.34030  ORF Transcript_17506/g.34030 Transcript_17506/m.34030 type:complete len:275 (+) Transcript_17506:4104-4928(+)